MRKYTAELYENLVENIDDEAMQRCMQDERNFLAGIPGVQSETLVDLGAGYGRVIPFLSSIASDVVAIELNPDMYPELDQRAKALPNVTAIQGDFLKLGNILPPTVERPVFLILQNSLGTIEGGDSDDAMNVVVEEATALDGQFVLSLSRQSALSSYGVNMYGKLQAMIGKMDMAKTDFEKGIMVTDTGYTSKWWTDEDIEGFRNLGTVVREKQTDEYQFLQIKV